MISSIYSSSNNATNFKKKNVTMPSFKGGAIAVLHTDSIVEAQKALTNNPTMQHFLGGNVNDIIKMLHAGNFKGISELLPSPISNGDGPHNYWLKNPFQLSTKFPNGINSYSELLVELYKNRTNLVSDGAFVNTGIMSGMFQDVLRNGDISCFKNFYTFKDGGITLGIFSPNRKVRKHQAFKIVNSKYDYHQLPDGKIEIKQNENYKNGKPTYLQVYDKRYVKNSKDDKLIPHYDKNQNSIYEISSYRDSCYPFNSEIDPEELNRNVKLWNKEVSSGVIDKNTDMYGYEGAQNLLVFKNFNIDDKNAAKGYVGWDAKMEIPKLNYANPSVRDYVINAGKYMTKTSDDILLLHIAKNNNVTSKTNNKLTDIAKDNFILQEIINMPLASIEFGDNINRVLNSPYISKFAFNAQDVGKSRLETDLKNIPQEFRDSYKQMSKLYSNEIFNYTNKVLEDLNKELPEKLFENGKITEYGRHALPIVVPNITKYSLIKSLAPNAEIKLSNNKLSLDYDIEKLNDVTLQSFGVSLSNIKEEAPEILTRIKHGFTTNVETNEIKNIVKGMLENTTTSSFINARKEMDINKIGLDWRLDAAKDIKTGKTLDEELSSISSMWGAFSSAVREKNPNSKVFAEFTDMHRLYEGRNSEKYPTVGDFMNHLHSDLGIGDVCYGHWFSDLPNIVNDSANAPQYFRNKMTEYLNAYPYKVKQNSELTVNKFTSDVQANANTNQIFTDNNDQPKTLHFMTIDPYLFNSGLKTNETKKIATKVLEHDYLGPERILSENEYSQTSSRAIAMAYSIRNGFANMPQISANNKEALEIALSDLVKGHFKDLPDFVPADFGVKPVDITIKNVIEQAKYNSEKGIKPFNLDEKQMDELAKDIYRSVMDKPLKRYIKLVNMMNAIPGSPSITVGNLTGYESVSNNKHLSNRAMEYIKTDDVFPEFRKEINNILGIRKNPNLKALSEGDYKMLPNLDSETSLLRETPDGNVVISVVNPSNHNLTIKSVRLSYDDNYNPAKHLNNGDIMTDINGKKYKVVKYGGWFVEPVDGSYINVADNENCVLHLYKSTNQDLKSQMAVNAYAGVS